MVKWSVEVVSVFFSQPVDMSLNTFDPEILNLMAGRLGVNETDLREKLREDLDGYYSDELATYNILQRKKFLHGQEKFLKWSLRWKRSSPSPTQS